MKNKPAFQAKLFWYFYFLTLACIIALAIPWGMYMRDTVRERQLSRLEQSAAQTAQQIDSRIGALENAALYLSASVSGLNFENSETALAMIPRLMMSLQVPRAMEYARISFYNRSGYYTYSGRYVAKKCLDAWLGSPEFLAQYDWAAGSRGRCILPPHGDAKFDSQTSMVSVLRGITSLSTYRSIGVIEIETELARFREDLLAAAANGTDCALFGEDGRAYCFTENFPGEDSDEIEQMFANGAAGGASTAAVFAGRRYLVSVAQVPICGWRVMLACPEDVILQPFNDMMRFFCVSLALLALLAFVGVYLLSRRMSKSLRALSDAVASVDPERLDFDARSFEDSREMKNLSRTFAVLLERLRVSSATLVERETRLIRANLMVLQSQMDPHFLYNMFSTIDSFAYARGVPEICEICQRMSKMLRYVTSFDKSDVPLSAEILHARDYLALMKYRYEDNFTYEIRTDEELPKELSVPRHIIQPLLENCFKHGFKRKAPPWRIDVEISARGGQWRVRVRDNGTGFDPARREEIFRQADALLSGTGESVYGLSMDGMGLVNTFARLRLRYGERAVMEILSDDGSAIVMGGE